MEKDNTTSFTCNSKHYESVVTKAMGNAILPYSSALNKYMQHINSMLKHRESAVTRAMENARLPYSSALDNHMQHINSMLKHHESAVTRTMENVRLPYSSALNKHMQHINSMLKHRESAVTRAMENARFPYSSALDNHMQHINSMLKHHESAVTRTMENVRLPYSNAFDKQLQNINKLLRNEDWTQVASEVSKQITQPNFCPTPTDIAIAAQHIEKQVHEAVIPAYDKSTPQDVNIALVQTIEKLTTQIANIRSGSDASESTQLSSAAKFIIKCVLDLIASALLSYVILPIPANLPAYEHKAMLNAARTYVSSQTTISNVRIVKVNGSLNVRLRPNKKSRIIGKLPRLAVVLLEDKTKKWTFIRYIDQDGNCELAGWVCSKYLCKSR